MSDKMGTVDSFSASTRGVHSFTHPDFIRIAQDMTEEKVHNIILSFINSFKVSSDFTNYSAHLEGEVYPDFTEENLFSLNSSNVADQLLKLPCSLKLTGLQTFIPEIGQLTKSIYKKTGFPVTCNMYITPPGNKNCFTYHIDPHKVYIMQIMGTKKWVFPIEKGSKKNIFYPNIVMKDELQIHKEVEELNLQTKSCIYLSKGTLHRAYHSGNGPSIHLSFAGLEPDCWQFLNQILPEEKKTDLEDAEDLMNNSDLSDANLIRICHKYTQVENLDIPFEINRFKERKRLEGAFIAKYGRPYSLKALYFFQKFTGVK